jgi:glycerophosphoryl diester phosphodiesterase
MRHSDAHNVSAGGRRVVLSWKRWSSLALLWVGVCGPVDALDLQGHRGARALAPENTLHAFALALGIGVTTLELDIAITKDDVLVISHDPALNPDITRGPDGRFLEGRGPPIRQLTFDEVQRHDVGRIKPGTRYASQFPQQQPIDGARIPRLADLFALVRKSGNEQVRFAIETKVTPFNAEETAAPEAFARAVIAAIREGGMARRASILSFDWRTLAVVQKEAPEIGTVYITAQQQWLDNIGAGKAEASPWTRGIQYKDHGSVPKMVNAAGGRTWSAYFGDLDTAKVKEAHALGIEVLAWTVNSARDIARMLDLGVDGIVSDRPDLVREEMRRRGLALPAPTPVTP